MFSDRFSTSRNGRTARAFYGSPYRAGDPPNPGPGSIENIPHVPVHVWTGDPTQPNREDMGNFYSAARDPIFYAHHGNVDRLWTVWETLGGRRQNITDPDWLNSSFVFYDENAQMVRVRVRDCLSTRKLGYEYQRVDIPWLNTRPTPRVSRDSTSSRRLGVANLAGIPSPGDVFPTTLDKVVKVLVKRPATKRSKKEKEETEETLVVDGIEAEGDDYVKFDVYVNDEDEALCGPDKTEFAGSFAIAPHRHGNGSMTIKTCLRLSITELLEDLGSEDDEFVLVTLVPRCAGSQATKIGGVSIVLED